MVLTFWLISYGEKTPPVTPPKPHKSLATAEDVIDPREKWTYRMEKMQKESMDSLGEATKENTILKEQLTALIDRVQQLEAAESPIPQEEENPLSFQDFPVHPLESTPAEKPKMVHVSLEGDLLDEKEDLIRNADNYIPAGTFVPSVLLTGTVVGTGTTSNTDPQPILIRFTADGVIPKGVSKGLEDAVLIGACQGDISSERAYCRLQTLTITEPNGEIIEKDVEGWVIGEDGRPGIKGIVVDRSSEVVRLAMINGILGGMASFFQQQASTSVYPMSPLVGQINALDGKQLVKAGALNGANNALEKMADFAIKKAEQMQPVIVIESGRRVDVVFKKGVDLKDSSFLKKETHHQTKDLVK